MEGDFFLEGKELECVNKRKNKQEFGFFSIAIIIVLTAVITYFSTVTFTLKSYLNSSDATYLSTKLGIIKDKLQQTYINDMDDNKMVENAIKGYVSGLGDKYTQYLTKEDMQSLLESTTGSYVGIGVYMANNTVNDAVVIVGVIDGSSAQAVGLKSGDIIKKVNDVDYSGEQLDAVSDVVKGEEGTDVKLTIERDSKEMDFNIRRSSIKVKSVGHTMVDDDIAYIQIASFNEGTADEFTEAYKDLEKNNPKGLVIDLRDNGGGLVEESLEIAETMVEKGKTLLITADKNKNEKVNKSTKNPIVSIPVVVLINENTASASEILAGIMRDDCNYKIIGKNSYGKGVIQSIYSFTDGSGLKVTMEEYFTPNHNAINNIGIAPDIEVDLDEEWKNISGVPYEYDLQLQKAVEQLKQ